MPHSAVQPADGVVLLRQNFNRLADYGSRPKMGVQMTTSKRVLSRSCTLLVAGWDESAAWFPSMGGYVERRFMRSLQLSTPMSRAEAKNVVKKIAARAAFEVFLANDRYASGMCHSLESIGGKVSLRRGAE